MKSIPLKGAGGEHSVIIDDDDYEWLSKMCWYVVKVKNKNAHGSYFSVRTTLRRVWDDGFTWHRATTMHRVILDHHGVKCAGFFVDHINGDTLDNRKENLRLATNTENVRNSTKRRSHNGKPCSSRYKGVTWYPWNKMLETGTPWNAQIRHNNKLHNLGYFATEEMAAKAYDAMAVTLFGEYARTNF